MSKQSDNLILVKRISATEAARNFADLLDQVTLEGESFTVIRRGSPVAQLTPVAPSARSALASILEVARPDPGWADELAELREWAGEAVVNDPWPG